MKLTLEERKKLDSQELELLRSKISDKKDLIDLDYEQTIEGIKEDEEAYKKVAKKSGYNSPDLSVSRS